MCQARAVPARLLACILLALLVSGCGRIRRTGQCVGAISTLNTALDDVAGRAERARQCQGERNCGVTKPSPIRGLPIDRPS
jgi:hypothetical protein